ncbi:MAG: hypothetical protein A2Y98_02330 [Candidatus Portnoybacteria bacterium RBG_19FT_COMBO_36_7]|uniref:Uncharacterized protein n=1 Tax=Candidatus Portnoybacteria bacterium RBG_19FT_COMBO_36_7 TaxID=1801992 RepID=A0A1G2F960_9BACT|nr:MAG: hypothetical protein A2Y98_02330 [Candidatus Portnoybacteria bacterium RBG_19FT_COMBO_36_7]
MKNSKILSWSIINSLAAFVYISGVAWLMFNGEKFFGKAESFWMPVALLLLFVISATIVGALILGRPILLYLDGKKSDAITLLAYTVGCLFIVTIITFILLYSF